MTPGQLYPLKADRVRVAMAWDVDTGGWKGVQRDLDVACVAVNKKGQVDMTDCIYYGNLENKSKSIKHSGDNTTGKGDGNDERISLQMREIPNDVYALYFILSAAGHNQSLSCLKQAKMRLIDKNTGFGISRYSSEELCESSNTSFFLMRIARNLETGHWYLAPM